MYYQLGVTAHGLPVLVNRLYSYVYNDGDDDNDERDSGLEMSFTTYAMKVYNWICVLVRQWTRFRYHDISKKLQRHVTENLSHGKLLVVYGLWNNSEKSAEIAMLLQKTVPGACKLK